MSCSRPNSAWSSVWNVISGDSFTIGQFTWNSCATHVGGPNCRGVSNHWSIWYLWWKLLILLVGYKSTWDWIIIIEDVSLVSEVFYLVCLHIQNQNLYGFQAGIQEVTWWNFWWFFTSLHLMGCFRQHFLLPACLHFTHLSCLSSVPRTVWDCYLPGILIETTLPELPGALELPHLGECLAQNSIKRWVVWTPRNLRYLLAKWKVSCNDW